MDPLRLIILFIGLVVIAGIYLRYREPKQSDSSAPPEDKPSLLDTLRDILPSRKSGQDERDEPDISMEDVESFGSFQAHGSEVKSDDIETGIHVGWDSMTPVDPKDEVLIVFNILAKPGEQFHGPDIQTAAIESGFKLGDKDIFDYRNEKMNSSSPAVCSFANAIEPGHFAALESEEFASPGISLFAQLPGPLDARETFKLTLDKAHGLASSLGGILCDESRSILSEQTVGHIKEKVEAFRFKQQMAAKQQRRH
ncbi:MAG: cell division protein ZipA C-terminal FtsZ-binding domain-containing protein [Gammaproteobacteria bacterium]|nr:cell division protein ZipA C-terminal FtsZ-binding domain-containing protein [Gammaproteobacteria bacterium]